MTKKDLSKKAGNTSTTKNIKGRASQLFLAIDRSYNEYLKNLTPRKKLIDVFLVFLFALGVLQFVYVLVIGNFPFNAFLGGFISCVGQFVLTVSLRMQFDQLNGDTSSEQSKEMIDDDEETSKLASENDSLDEVNLSISPVRAFGDYIISSLILHFIVSHFIN